MRRLIVAQELLDLPASATFDKLAAFGGDMCPTASAPEPDLVNETGPLGPMSTLSSLTTPPLNGSGHLLRTVTIYLLLSPLCYTNHAPLDSIRYHDGAQVADGLKRNLGASPATVLGGSDAYTEMSKTCQTYGPSMTVPM